MKKKFTFLIAALMLLAMFASPFGMLADEASYVFNTDAGIAALGITKPSTGEGTDLSTESPYEVGQISMSVTHGGTNTRVWNSNGTLDLRIYKDGGSLTFSAASGYSITGITVTGSTVGTFSVNEGTYSNGSWSNGTTGSSSVILTATNTGKINTITVTYSTGGSSLTPSNLTITNASTDLGFDLYNNSSAQVINYTTSSSGAITITPTSPTNYFSYVHDEENKTITVTPIAVTSSTQTVTISQAVDDTYATGSVTFSVDIEDSTPSVTFDATTDTGESPLVKNGVTFACSSGALNNGSEYRLYKNSVTTFSVSEGTITKIVFTGVSGNPASGFASQTGWTTNGNNGTWTGSATSVSFTASGAQVRATQIVVTVETPDPTISASNVNIAYNATSSSINYTISNEPDPAGTLTAVSSDNWLKIGTIGETTIPLSCTANSLATARTATVTLTYTYDENKTVTTTVSVTQETNTTQGGWVLTSLSDLTSSDIFVIVGTDDDDDTFALPNDGGASSAPVATSITINSATNTLSSEPADNLKWNVGGNATDGYTFYQNGTTESWLYCTAANNGVRVGTNDNNKLFHMDNDGYMVNNATYRILSIYVNKGTPQDWRCYTNYNNNPVTITFYKKVDAPVIPSYNITINPYTSNENGWNLIASPIASEIPASSVTNLVSNTYDLYYFDQSQTNKQWVNYKYNEGNINNGFGLEAGKGYLYANSAQVTLTFTGTAYSGDGEFDLDYADVTNNAQGWNLMGNPFSTTAYADKDFYVMNENGSELSVSGSSSTPIPAMNGIFVHATEANQKVTFSTSEPGKSRNNNALVINLNRNDNVIDRAIVRFGESEKLSKFQLFEGSTKIYIPHNGDDYAIVAMDDNTQTFSLNFHAKTTGKYTLSLGETSNLSYVHIFDRMTGEDVDMLLEDSYSFIGSPADSEERFIVRLNYNASPTDSETFAYQSGNGIIVNGEGELQIFDVTGRKVMTTTINGVQTVNGLNNGLYIFKLNEKTQKIVVR